MERNLVMPVTFLTPSPDNFNGAGGPWPAAVGKVYPGKHAATGPSDIIDKYLNGIPGSLPRPKEKFLLISPVGSLGDIPSFLPKITPSALPNGMPQVGGVTLNNKPLLSNLEINPLTYTDNNGVTKGYPFMVFDTVLITCRQQKNIVETNIQGSDDGAIFEYSGLANYDLTINIIIASGQNGVYPQKSTTGVENGVEDVIKALVSPYPISINSWYLQMMDINQIVVTGYDLSMTEGGISQQAITITAKSNKNTVLIIQQPTANPTS